MERVLPKTLDYTDVLPLAVESRSRRRTFFPINGQSFSSDGANIIRIDLSADALLDTQHSYLRFRFRARGAACGIDQAGGHSFIRRLRVEQSGTVLEDINSYNRLMGAIVLPCQSSNEHNSERAITEGIMAMGKAVGQAAAGAIFQTQVTGQSSAELFGGNQNGDAQVAADDYFTFSIPLNSGLLNNSKLIPLMLMSAPLTIELELAPSIQPVCWAGAAPGGTYDIDNVRYIANLIEVGQDVAAQLRMVQEVSGGVLTLAGQTYRHFTGTLTAGMKSMFFCGQGAGSDGSATYDVAQGNNLKLQEYQLKIGSVVYPPTPVRCDFGAGGDAQIWDRRGEPLMELAKAWGSVGSTKGMGQLTNQNVYKRGDALRPTAFAGARPLIQYSPFGLDLEAFQRVAIESGVNTADRSLPISLILNISTDGAVQQNIDAYVLADALFYLNADGSMSVSV